MGGGSLYIEIAMTDFCGGGQNFDFLGDFKKNDAKFSTTFWVY